MNPNIWGPHAWTFLHFITLSYPKNPTETDKYNMNTFLKSLEHVLPCDVCKIHYKENTEEIHPLTNQVLSSKENLVKWLIDVHNTVNKRNGKKILEYSDVIRMYVDMNDSNTSNYKYNSSFNDTVMTCICIICIILLVLIISAIGYNML